MDETNKVMIDLIMKVHDKIDKLNDKIDKKIDEVEDKIKEVENTQYQARGYLTALSMVICMAGTVGFELLKKVLP